MRAFVPFGRITLVVVALLLAFAFVLVAQSSSITSSSAFRTGTDSLWTTFGGDKSSKRKDISFDLSIPPVAGCEDIVNDLQQKLIQRYSVLFKGVRHANIWGYLETENKGDAAIWAAQQILLSYLGIQTMESCRYDEPLHSPCRPPGWWSDAQHFRCRVWVLTDENTASSNTATSPSSGPSSSTTDPIPPSSWPAAATSMTTTGRTNLRA
jgi:hypothetical protein